jgi:hypothetical protein
MMLALLKSSLGRIQIWDWGKADATLNLDAAGKHTARDWFEGWLSALYPQAQQLYRLVGIFRVTQ